LVIFMSLLFSDASRTLRNIFFPRPTKYWFKHETPNLDQGYYSVLLGLCHHTSHEANDEWVWSNGGMVISRGKWKDLEENQFIHQESHLKSHGIKLRSPWWEASIQLPLLWHSLVYINSFEFTF
jgi:hypothetical protein